MRFGNSGHFVAIIGTIGRSGHFFDIFGYFWALLSTLGTFGHFSVLWALLGTLGTPFIVPTNAQSANNAQSAQKCPVGCPIFHFFF